MYISLPKNITIFLKNEIKNIKKKKNCKTTSGYYN